MDLCQICVELLPLNDTSCISCAAPLATTGQNATHAATQCGACLKSPPPVRRTIARCEYAFPADYLIQQLKFAHQLKYARVMGGLLAESVGAASKGCDVESDQDTDRQTNSALVTDKQYSAVDLVVPVPLSPKRYRERGFNQAAELARFTAASLKLRLCHNTLRRPLDQQPQAKLGRNARRRNILGAFSCEKSLSGQRIALVDDVMTTGATVFEAAKTLRQAGAASIDVWVFARTSGVN